MRLSLLHPSSSKESNAVTDAPAAMFLHIGSSISISAKARKGFVSSCRRSLVATTRIALPHAKVRLSAGRSRMSREAQALCFFAGANSIFYGNKLLTAQNPETDADHELLQDLGLVPQRPFSNSPSPAKKVAINT